MVRFVADVGWSDDPGHCAVHYTPFENAVASRLAVDPIHRFFDVGVLHDVNAPRALVC